MIMALPRQFFRSYHMGFLVGIALCTTVSVNAQCPSNNVEFCSYYRLAEQGLARAQGILGVMYRKGEGIAQDKREAVRWYRKAGEQGLARAQNNLGLMYEKGEGIAQHKREAVCWYRKAAAQGDAKAQNNLGLMYYNGEGVITDDHEAYIWFSIAKANGDEGAAGLLRDINWNEYLTPEEIASARREATRRLDDM